MRRSVLVVGLSLIAAVWPFVLVSPAGAQTLPPAPSDFRLYGSLDVVVSSDGSSSLSLSRPVILDGWLFECRSGLQPQTQRVGEFSIQYWRIYHHPFGEIYIMPPSSTAVVGRPDVMPVFQSACPAVGGHTGFHLAVPPPPEDGNWTLELVVSTTDGAGRRITWGASRAVTFVQ